MKKQILTVAALFALFSGCGGKEDGAGASGSASVAGTPARVTLVPQAPSQTGGEQAAVDLVTGEKVYKSTCSICHKSGLKSAPRLGVKEDWEMRLTQSTEVLYDHAINGFRGKKGVMPSRGSNSKLTDAEVKAAVDYMMVHAIPSWTVSN